MTVYILPSKSKASDFCRKKNKYARKYRWQYYKRDKGGYAAYKTKK